MKQGLTELHDNTIQCNAIRHDVFVARICQIMHSYVLRDAYVPGHISAAFQGPDETEGEGIPDVLVVIASREIVPRCCRRRTFSRLGI